MTQLSHKQLVGNGSQKLSQKQKYLTVSKIYERTLVLKSGRFSEPQMNLLPMSSILCVCFVANMVADYFSGKTGEGVCLLQLFIT